MKNKQDRFQEILDEIQENLSETERDWYADEERKIIMREEMMNDPEAREALRTLLKDAGSPEGMTADEYLDSCQNRYEQSMLD